MTNPPTLSDRTALAARRRRTRDRALFVHRIAADQIHERLEEVNRTLTDVAIVTGQPGFWAERFPGARVVADADTLDLAPAAQDLVIHAMALHWADDPVGQLVQCRRALRPDGLFLAVTPGGRTLSELRGALAEAEIAVSGGLSPRVAPMADLRDLGALLQRAGFALPVADSDLVKVTYPDLWALMRELRHMGEGNALAARDRRPARRSLFERADEIYGANFAAGDGRIRASVELVFLTGWAPHESQQKPLRPGSARARLAEALNTRETPLPGPGDELPD